MPLHAAHSSLVVESTPAAQAFVRSLGLADVRELIDFRLVAPFKEKPFTKVYRLTGGSPERTCFLKITPFNPKKSLLRYLAKTLLRREFPHTESFHVHDYSRRLQALGLAAMDVIAYGERRRFGYWPVTGFALCAAVPGHDLSDLFKASPAPARHALLQALGWQLAQMHAAGLFINTRLHDYFVHPAFFSNPSLPPAERLTLIDLDFADSTWRNATLSVAHSVYLSLRTGIGFTPREVSHFVRSYRQALRARGLVPSRHFIRDVRRRVQQELAAHFGNPALVRQFPDTPRPASAALQ